MLSCRQFQTKEPEVERRYYDASSLESVLGAFEERYGLTSEAFYEAHVAGEPLDEISGFHRHAWASFYRNVRRLRGDFAAHAERLLELA
jgi:hypothetical protein